MSAIKRKIILKKLTSHDTIWHPETSLVFKSHNERLVIGRYNDKDDEIIPLDDEALELCEEWKFKPDESLIEIDNEDDENDEEDEQDQKVVEPVVKVVKVVDPVVDPVVKVVDPVVKVVDPVVKVVKVVEPVVKVVKVIDPVVKVIEPVVESVVKVESISQGLNPLDYSILTKEYTESLLKTVVSIENIRSVLESLNQDKITLISQLTKTQEDLSISIMANKELQTKFDAIKSLFS